MKVERDIIDLYRPAKAIWRDEIQMAVSYATGITEKDMLSRDRRRPIAYARFMVFLLLHETGKYGYIEIGRRYGYDHTSIIHAVRKAKQLALTNDTFRAQLTIARSEIYLPEGVAA